MGAEPAIAPPFPCDAWVESLAPTARLKRLLRVLHSSLDPNLPTMFCLKSLQSKELLLPPRLGSGPGKLPCLEGLALEQAQIQEYVVSYPDKPCFLSASVRAPASAGSSRRCPGAARRWLSGLWRKDFDGEVAPLSCSWRWGQKPARGFCGSAAKMLRAAADAGGGGGMLHTGADPQADIRIQLRSWAPAAVQLSCPLL